MNSLAKNTFILFTLVLFSVFPIFAKEMINYDIKIYQLPEDKLDELEIEELIAASELIHHPSLLVKPNEEAKVEIGIEGVSTMEMILKSNIQAATYSTTITQKQNNNGEPNIMSSTPPDIEIGGQLSFRMSNTGGNYLIQITSNIIEKL